uniref:Uncharacterized protein n=1 Tax=Meloidogyne incognita TaxID=6306 RepID=A0A914L2B9_MELIC
MWNKNNQESLKGPPFPSIQSRRRKENFLVKIRSNFEYVKKNLSTNSNKLAPGYNKITFVNIKETEFPSRNPS